MNKNYDKKIFRLMFILNKLDRGESISTKELSKEFNVSVRTVQRDIELLNMSGFPIVSYEKGTHSFEENFSLKKVMLSNEEASLLTLMYDVSFALGESFKDSFSSILKKVIHDNDKANYYIKMPKRLKVDVCNNSHERIEEAIKKHNKIKILYKKVNNNEEKNYILSPLKIIYYDGYWYLLGLNENRLLVKFRFENIKEVDILVDKYDPLANLQTILDESVNIYFTNKRDIDVVLRVEKEISTYFEEKEIFPMQKFIKKNEDLSIIIETKIGNSMEIIPVIFKWLPFIKVIEPHWLNDEIKDKLQAYLLML